MQAGDVEFTDETTRKGGTSDVAHAPPPVPALRDYDAPDPQRNAVTVAHATANTAATAWIIWQMDWTRQDEIYFVSRRSLSNNVTHGFAFDADGLTTNMFGHPVHGGLFFNAARATGLSFWESAVFPALGSLGWELFSELQYPSANDLICTSLGGIVLGEMMYRLSSLTLDEHDTGSERLKHEVMSGLVSPTRGLNRLVTGEAWRDGASPVPKAADVHFDVGVDRVRFESVKGSSGLTPSALLALDVEYGDLAPVGTRKTIRAYEFFDLYAAAIASSSEVGGVQLQTLGLLHGWSQELSADEGRERDNNVFGFTQSMDFQGSEVAKFGAFGLGVGDFVIVRSGVDKRFRFGMDLEWNPLVAASSPFTTYEGTDRDYNFSMGGSVGLGFRWNLGRFGELGLRARQYGTRVVDGADGEETIGYARAWYELDLIKDSLGIGIAPTFIDRIGRYAQGARFHGNQLSNQFFFTVHP